MTSKAPAADADASRDAAVSPQPTPVNAEDPKPAVAANAAVELGGREGLDPTRYGDWELRGRCIDF